MSSSSAWFMFAIAPLLTSLTIVTSASIEYERYDGWFNNLANPSWGAVATPLSRVVPPLYEDGVYQPSGSTRPNPLNLSECLMSPNNTKMMKQTKSYRNASVIMVFFGEHVAHEIMDTIQPGCPPEHFDIKVPPGHHIFDKDYSGDQYLPFTRTNYDKASGHSPNTPRQQINEATPWLDGGAIYGTSKSWADSLRTFTDGKLEVSEMGNWPKENTIGLPMHNPSIPSTNELKDAKRILKLGDRRGNENPFLLSISVLWFRYHNLMADKIKKKEPTWNDDKIFNEARKWVIATYQHIVFYEWLPVFLGPSITKQMLQNEYKYKGYKSTVHPGVSHIFQSAAMRFSETMVPSRVFKAYANDCNYVPTQYKNIRLCNNYWNAEETIKKKDGKEEDSINPIIYGMVNQIAEAEDNVIVEDLRGYFYGPLDHSRSDSAALNIQLGRDHGLPDYNTARKAFGLEPISDFRDINNDTEVISDKVIKKMAQLYNQSNNIDIWVGGMMESGKNGPGPLFRTVILDQFLRIRDGDRFWYENYEKTNHFNKSEIEEIKKITFKDIIASCTNIRSNQLQNNVFLVTDAKCRVKTSGVMEQCTELQTYDYFSGSEISFALTFLLVGLLPFIALGILCCLARIRNAQRQKQIAQSRKRSNKLSVNRNDESQFAAIEWESKTSSRVVSVTLGPGTSIKVLSKRNQILRMINTKHMRWITIVKQNDKEQNMLSIRVQREYDLVLTFDDRDARETFLQHLETFIKEACPDLEIQEHVLRSREILATAVTRESRQQQLEKFFRAAFARAFDLDCGDDCKNFKLSATEIKEILGCELSQMEFADALAMQPSSPFVEQMFKLADKDRNGYLSFREFLDIIFIFAKGSPQDKLKLFFDMYDVNGNGKLDRAAFKKMMKSFMDVVNASVDAENLDQLVESMFTTESGEKEFLNFEDFGTIMLDLDKKQGLLSDVSNVFKGPTSSKAFASHKTWSPKRKLDSVGSSVSRRRPGTLVQRNRLGNKPLSEGSTPRSASRLTLARSSNLDYAPYYIRQYVALKRYIENHRQHIFILSLYTIIMFGMFSLTAYKYAVGKEHSGFRQVTGYGIIVSRGAASVMMFTFSTLLLTMSRNTITFLRETLLMNWIPFDSAIAFHKYVALWAFFFTVVHTIGHGINFYHFSTQSPTDLSCLLTNDFHRSHELPKFHYYCWQTITGSTGVILCVIITFMYIFASQFSRRAVFKFFWWTHQLYIVLYALMILHGSGHLIQSPSFHLYILGPATLFTVDKLISMSRKKVEIPVTKAELLPSDVTHLEFKRPVNFNYKSGQWVRIACLELGGSEYHPFTLTSAPHEENLSLHIRAVGPWTMNLRNTYNRENLQDRPFPKLYLDGPFGEGHQDWYRFEVSVLVGGGIGVTPFASILKDIAHKGSLNSTFCCKQVYFLWVTRTQKHFEWLTEIIREVEEKDTTGLVTVHIFITQFYEKFDLRTTMLYICERHFQKISGRSLFTGLQSITHFGRPDFDTTLRSISAVHPEVGKIGVFSCGPPTMTRSVEKTCAQLNISNGPTFIHHFENF